jgi:hypothetical protein
VNQPSFDSFDGRFSDRIEEAAYGYMNERGAISDLADFANFCLIGGYLDGFDPDYLRRLGAVAVIKQEFKREDNGLRRWICTGEGKDREWVSRRFCTAEQHADFCRLLKKKRDQVNCQLCMELDYHSDRWGQEVSFD